MSHFSTVLQRIGGPASVTWWSFGILMVDRLIASGVAHSGVTPPEFTIRALCVIAAQVAMFIPLFALWLLQQNDPKPRPLLTIVAFLSAAVIRAWVLDQSLHQIAGTRPIFEERLFASIYTVMLILLITSFATNTLQERRHELENLLNLRAQLDQARTRAEAAVQHRNEELIDRVREVMEQDLAALESASTVAAIDSLRRTARQVIRPMSHSLAQSFRTQQSEPTPLPSVRLGLRAVLADASVGRIFRPVFTALALSGTLLSVAAVYPGVLQPALIGLGICALVLALANRVLRALLIARSAQVRAVTVIVVGFLAGVATRTTVGISSGWAEWSRDVMQASVYYVTVISIAVAAFNSVLASREQVLSRTAEATEELQRHLVRTRQVDWFHQRALSNLLHGPVQSAVEAAAHRLDAEARQTSSSSDVIDRVRQDLLETLDVLQTPAERTTDLQTGLARIAATWEGICEVSFSVDSESVQALGQDPIARSCALSVITEAASNSVRHGHARHMSVEMRHAAGALEIVICDDGRESEANSAAGLGSAFLDDCSLRWSLSDESPGHRLYVLLPVKPEYQSGDNLHQFAR